MKASEIEPGKAFHNADFSKYFVRLKSEEPGVLVVDMGMELHRIDPEMEVLPDFFTMWPPAMNLNREAIVHFGTVLKQMDSMFDLDRLGPMWEDRMKELAAQVLKPGSKKVIREEDGGLSALDYIWNMFGDRSWSSDQKAPFRPRALDYYVGRKVEHLWGKGILVKTPEGTAGNGYGIKLDFPCHCGRKTFKMYAIPGVHNGGFAYLVQHGSDKRLDVRNQVMVCKVCGPIVRGELKEVHKKAKQQAKTIRKELAKKGSSK